MPTNNILLFDQNKGNMMGDTEYNTNQQRLNGVQSGIASSQLQNKFQYQVSLVAYAIASLMYNNGLDANDADAVSAFVSNLSGTLVQKVLDKASTSEAQAGTVDTKWMSPALVKAAIDFTSVQLSGSTMTGPLILNGDPTQNLEAATKQYVDEAKASVFELVLNVNATQNQQTINFTRSVSNAKMLLFSLYATFARNDNSGITLQDLNNKSFLNLSFSQGLTGFSFFLMKNGNVFTSSHYEEATNFLRANYSVSLSNSFVYYANPSYISKTHIVTYAVF